MSIFRPCAAIMVLPALALAGGCAGVPKVAEATAPDFERVVVQPPRPVVSAPAPLRIYTREELDATGAADIAQALRLLHIGR
jgi:hypothetical protein